VIPISKPAYLGKGQPPGIVIGYFFIWAVYNGSYNPEGI
jgi:hypothetical protein